MRITSHDRASICAEGRVNNNEKKSDPHKREVQGVDVQHRLVTVNWENETVNIRERCSDAVHQRARRAPACLALCGE